MEVYATFGLELLTKEASDSYHHAVEDRYRILSLADSRENHHLWANYADNYAGICLEFLVNPLLGTAFQVQYAETLPTLDITNNEGFDELVATVLTKRLKWQDEGEYRLVLADPPINGDPLLIGQKLHFPRYLLTSIIFGYRVNIEHRNRLTKLIQTVAPHMQIFEATGGPPFQKITITPMRI